MIVQWIAVSMVHNLFSIKKASKFLLHYKPMLRDVAAVYGIGVIWSVEVSITFSYGFAASPVGVPFARLWPSSFGS